MKKITIILFVTLAGLINFSLFSQNTTAKSEITVFARYTNNKGMELRIVPDKKYTLNLGIKYGFIVERADANTSNFIQIGETKAFTSQEWQDLIDREKDVERKKQIQMVQFFFENVDEKGVKKIDFSKGIKDLKDKKSGDDLTFTVFLLSALKDAEIAKALGMTYFDNTAVKGKMYRYRAKLKKPTKLYQMSSPVLSIKAIEKKDNYKNYFFSKQGDTKISFYWEDIPGLHGFDIERAEHNSRTFVKLNKAPIYTLTNKDNTKIPNTYVDKGLTNYKKYTYRFYAHSVFGERIKLFETTTFPVDLTPPPVPKIFKPVHKSPNEVLIHWEMKNIPKDFKGFAVARSTKNRGKFKVLHKKLLPKNVNSFIDKSFSKEEMNYYIVQAIDTANNVSSTVPFGVVLIDSIPPKKPIIKYVKVDSLGLVKISVALNKEKDLMGYRIFRANSDKHEFSAIQESFISSDSIAQKVKTVFKDTVSLNSLTKNIYYRVKALDFNYNQSDFSDIYVAKRPDTIPPSIPVIKNIKAYEDRIVLNFALSKSRDVKSHYIYRKSDLNGKWKLLATLKNDAVSYTDKNTQKGITYYYSLRALDTSGLFSNYSTTVYSSLIDKGLLPEISNFKAIVKDNKAKLSWKYSGDKKNTYFVIYRKTPKGKLRQYKQTKNLHFEDVLTQTGTYQYAVKAFSKKGHQSVLSRKLKLTN